MDSSGLGFLLVLLGLGFWLATSLTLRSIARRNPSAPARLTAWSEEESEAGETAVIAIEEGGRLAYLNARARRLFRLRSAEMPTLERLARHFRDGEAFLGLCAAEGQARFILDGRLVTGSSHKLPFEPAPLTIVSLSAPEVAALLSSGEEDATGQTLGIFCELAQEMAANLGLLETIRTIFNNLEKLIPADYLEVTLYDAEKTCFIPYRSQGFEGSQRRIEVADQSYPSGEGLTGYLQQQQEPLRIADIEKFGAARPLIDLKHLPIRSFLGAPLLANGEMIGTLELAVFTPDAYRPEHQQILTLLSGQVAHALRNALLYEKERKRSAELSGLVQLTQSFRSVRDPKDLFSNLLQSIAPLVDVQVLGFLIYDDNQRLLKAQAPFYGLPSQFMDLYQAQIQLNGPAEALLLEQKIILSKNAAEDERWEVMGLAHVAQAASLRDTALVPLTSNGRFLGYLHASNHRNNNQIFTHEEIDLLTIIASQCAPIVENAALIQQARLRAQRAEALRRIASLATSAASLDEILKYSLQELVRLLHGSMAVLFLVDQERSSLQIHEPSFHGDSSVLSDKDKTLPLDDPQFPFTVTGHQHPRISRRLSEEKAIIPFYKNLQSLWRIESVLIVPLISRNEGIGEIWIGSYLYDYFDQGDLQAVIPASSHLASVVEQSYLAVQTDESLRRRVEQLTALTQISREMSTTLELNALLQLTYDQTLRATGADCGTILVLQKGNAGGPQKVGGVAGDPPAAGELSETDLHVLERGEHLYIPDVAGAGTTGLHEDVLSALWLPLHYQQKPIGLITLHSRQVDFFDPAIIEFGRAIAAQVAVVLANAQQYDVQTRRSELLRRELEKLEQHTEQPLLAEAEGGTLANALLLARQVDRLRAGLEVADLTGRQPDIPAVLRTLANEILTRYDFETALVAENGRSGPRLVEVIGSLPEGANPDALLGQHNPLLRLLTDREVYLSSDLARDPRWQDSALLKSLDTASFVGIPLSISNEYAAGVLWTASKPSPRLSPFDQNLFTQLASQVSIRLQNLHLLTEMSRRLDEVNLLLDFSRKLGSLDAGNILQALVESARQAIPAAHAGWVALWQEKDRQLLTLASSGYTDDASLLNIRYPGKDNKTDGRDNLLPLRVYHSGQPRRIGEVNFAQDYNLAAEDLMHYRHGTGGRLPVSSMIAPVMRGEHKLGVLVIDNFDTPAAFDDEDEALAISLTQQTALALENANLFKAAEQRAAQLQALTEVSGTITASLQSSELVTLLLGQLNAVLPYDTATLWLRSGNRLGVAAASGFSDNESRINLSVAIQDSALFQEMSKTGKPISIGDIRRDARFSMLAESGKLSWLGIPLIAKSELVGVIALEKTEPDFYELEHHQIAATFAGQAAVSLENARLYEDSLRRAAELDQRSQRLALLNRLSAELGASLDADMILNLTVNQMLSALQVSKIAAIMIGEKGRYLLQAEAPAAPGKLPHPLPPSPLLDRLRQTQGIANITDLAAEPELAGLAEAYFEARHTRSLLLVPLAMGTNLYGWLAAQKEQPYHFSAPEIEMARTICNQTAIAIQNAHLFAETRRLSQNLEILVEERTLELRKEHHNTQTLLRIISELSTSLDMSLVLNRTLSVLNESLKAEESLIILAEESAELYRAGSALTGSPPARDAKKLRPEQIIAKHVIESRRPALIDDVLLDPRWDFPDHLRVSYHSIIGVPMSLGEETLGAMLLLHSQAAFFDMDQVNLAEAAARQISIALNNAELFKLIRDQAESLGGMLREQQIEARRSRAILEAVADGVLVTDANNTVALLNASAEHIFDLQAAEVIDKPLEQFAALFGQTAQSWLERISQWSEDPQSYPLGESYAEQIHLDNGKVIQVHLAAVIFQSAFLGTVSIIRDVTQQFQIERLKSEFIANVSHELRTPMTSIKGYVEIMLAGASGKLTPQQSHFLEIVKSNTERLNILVNDLLDVSRVETGRATFSFRPLDLKAMAQNVLEEIEERAGREQKKITFLLEAPDGLPKAKGDWNRIHQVLTNLVENSYNYTPESGMVEINLHHENQEVQVDVRDNGIGIILADQHRIFERFYRGDDRLVLQTAGAGLGLAISKTLVELHGGRIWFTSSGVRGEGCTFSFTLPVDEAED